MLTGMENRIIEAREHALSRKDILEKVEKWTLASAEEAWLDEYERVPNSPPTPNPYMLFCK
jgi:Ase1/PRC1/MAP65 family protein